ncbi:hypothetical protein RJT34_16768 [Clitoria ternatea]|uniref:Uncharacterized protein n=1 Tax=Clitoria ternatea TaxID=43366 RepID=A0AAN9J906_CLITE
MTSSNPHSFYDDHAQPSTTASIVHRLLCSSPVLVVPPITDDCLLGGVATFSFLSLPHSLTPVTEVQWELKALIAIEKLKLKHLEHTINLRILVELSVLLFSCFDIYQKWVYVASFFPWSVLQEQATKEVAAKKAYEAFFHSDLNLLYVEGRESESNSTGYFYFLNSNKSDLISLCFIGNSGLCGIFLNLRCHSSRPTERVTLSKAVILGITLGALVILMVLLAACRPHSPSSFPDGSLEKPGTYLRFTEQFKL